MKGDISHVRYKGILLAMNLSKKSGSCFQVWGIKARRSTRWQFSPVG